MLALAALACGTVGSSTRLHTVSRQVSLDAVCAQENSVLADFAPDSTADKIIVTCRRQESGGSTTVFVLDVRGGGAKRVYEGPAQGIFPAPVPGLFSLVLWSKAQHRIVVLSTDGEIHGDARFGWGDPQWTEDGKWVVFITDRPDVVDENSADYDPLGFTAVGILDLSKGQSRWFPVRLPAAHMYLARFDRKIYVSSELNENDPRNIVSVYDLEGRLIATRHDLHGTCFSPNGRYYVPQLHEEPHPWEIYDAKTNHPVRMFNRGLSYPQGYYSYAEWNPRNDDLILLLHDPDGFGYQEEHVYSAARGKFLTACPSVTCKWSADGRSLVSVKKGELNFTILQTD